MKYKRKPRITIQVDENILEGLNTRLQNEKSVTTMSELIREIIIKYIDDKTCINNYKKPKYEEVDTQLFLDIKKEIRRIGNNINQMAKTVNSIARKNETMSSSTEKRFAGSLEMLRSHLDDIVNRLTVNEE